MKYALLTFAIMLFFLVWQRIEYNDSIARCQMNGNTYVKMVTDITATCQQIATACTAVATVQDTWIRKTLGISLAKGKDDK